MTDGPFERMAVNIHPDEGFAQVLSDAVVEELATQLLDGKPLIQELRLNHREGCEIEQTLINHPALLRAATEALRESDHLDNREIECVQHVELNAVETGRVIALVHREGEGD